GFTDHRIELGSIFTQIHQAHIAAHTEPDESHLVIGTLSRGMGNHLTQILRFSTMVKTQTSVHLTTAGTVVPGQRIPAKRISRPGHACHIMQSAMPLPAVSDHHHASSP